ncbi:MAG: molybdopterin-binding protein [Firmicutes bacterium]|nr:molybdopterin-binding protein [Bacillota bacterium]
MKKIPVEKAVGMILCHDLTQIIKGEFKGPAFKKGHIITEEDIPRLLQMGKENLFVWEKKEGYLHEDEAVQRMADAVAGEGITLTDPSEGKISLISSRRGLLKVNVEGLTELNSLEQVIIATLHTDQVVEKDLIVAGTRAIPLQIDEKIIEQWEALAEKYKPVIQVKALSPLRVGMVVTGSEVYKGRIEDKFSPVVEEKVKKLGGQIFRKIYVDDNTRMIADAIQEIMREKVDLVVVTGGMSVDPDDLTPAGVVVAGGKIISYGSPTMPGAMFMVAYIGDIPVLGLPGCVMFASTTVFDLILPRIMAGETITRRDIVKLGHGGLCQGCSTCRFPACAFGKA